MGSIEQGIKMPVIHNRQRQQSMDTVPTQSEIQSEHLAAAPISSSVPALTTITESGTGFFGLITRTEDEEEESSLMSTNIQNLQDRMDLMAAPKMQKMSSAKNPILSNLNIKIDMDSYPNTNPNHLSFNSMQLKQQKMHLTQAKDEPNIIALNGANYGGTPIPKYQERKSRKGRKMKLIGSRKNLFALNDGTENLLKSNPTKDAYKEHRRNNSVKNVQSIAIKKHHPIKNEHVRTSTPSHVRSKTLPHHHSADIISSTRPKTNSLALMKQNGANSVDYDVGIVDGGSSSPRPHKIAAKYVMTKRSKAKLSPISKNNQSENNL